MKLIELKQKRLLSYKQSGKASAQAVKMMQDDILELNSILSSIKDLEPAGTLKIVAETIKRNTLNGADITVILIPNKQDIPLYPAANVVMADLTNCNIPDAHALWEMHRDGLACVEVDDFTGNNIQDVLALYANRGALYIERGGEV